jgi:hypothetical protein
VLPLVLLARVWCVVAWRIVSKLMGEIPLHSICFIRFKLMAS